MAKRTCTFLFVAAFFCYSIIACTPEEVPTASPTTIPTVQPTETAVPTAEEPTVFPTEPAAAIPLPLNGKIHIIYDDDGSPDGTTALLYLLSHPLADIIAANETYGEAYPEVYIQHIGRVLDSFGFKDIPLGYGQDTPLAGHNEFPEGMRQAANDFWGFPLPNKTKTYPTWQAPELYAEIINQSTEPVTIFISGPCTNLAQALRLDPGIKDKIAAVFIMGGAVNVPGNISDLLPGSANKVAEWNIYADPLAASEVFSSGLNIFLIPLDATNQVTVNRQDTTKWRNGGQIAGLAAEIYDTLLTNWGANEAAIWDLMTAAIMLQPDLCGFQSLDLQVVTAEGNSSGQTKENTEEGHPINVCLQPDINRIHKVLIEVFSAQKDLAVVNPEPTAGSTSGSEPEITASPTPQDLLFYDGFDGMLQAGWTWENENPNRWSFTPDGWLQILGEDNSLLGGQEQSNLLWRDLPEGDFVITVHLLAVPVADFQQATIYIYEDLDNYIAINRGFCSPCLPGGNGIFMEYKISGAWGAYSVAMPDTELFLRLESEANTISGYYATIPDEWQRLGRFGNYFTFKRVGLGVSNCDDGGENADLAGLFDYFEITRP
jgi:pyrimidine-specific ribonucleoside hydrolase